jgi:hypothetical protein
MLEVKSRIRAMRHDEARRLADAALELESAADVERLLRAHLPPLPAANAAPLAVR